MKNNNITLYIDITQFIKNRLQTGIQRVLREFLLRALDDNNLDLIILSTDTITNKLVKLDNYEIRNFLKNVKTYQFKFFEEINLEKQYSINKIFFDIDSIWNSPINRLKLYKFLNEYNYKICNFLYDLIPVLFPEYMYDETKKNFKPYLEAISKYSSTIFFDSKSCKNDFTSYIINNFIYKKIDKRVVYLGSDFNDDELDANNKSFITINNELLQKRFLLFVGTLEPRKRQDIALTVFKKLKLDFNDISLIFVGRFGWNIDDLKKKLINETNNDIYHFESLSNYDLRSLYKNAFLVLYLSEYEGFGLPVCESLMNGNITICSKNSSLNEVGKNFADFVSNNIEEVYKKVYFYLDDKLYYNNRKKYIKENYRVLTWNKFYEKVIKYIN